MLSALIVMDRLAAVAGAHHDPERARHVPHPSGNAEARFGGDLLAVLTDDLRVDEGQVRFLKLDDDHAPPDANLRRGEPDPVRPVHRVKHLVDQLLDLARHRADRLGSTAQHGRSGTVDRDDLEGPRGVGHYDHLLRIDVHGDAARATPPPGGTRGIPRRARRVPHHLAPRRAQEHLHARAAARRIHRRRTQDLRPLGARRLRGAGRERPASARSCPDATTRARAVNGGYPNSRRARSSSR